MRARFCGKMWDEKNGVKIKPTGGKQLVYGTHPDTMARVKMVRTEEWKLAIRETGGNELYNLKADPDEMKNLYGDAQYDQIVMDLQLKLIQWTLKTDTDRPFQQNVGA